MRSGLLLSVSYMRVLTYLHNIDSWLPCSPSLLPCYAAERLRARQATFPNFSPPHLSASTLTKPISILLPFYLSHHLSLVIIMALTTAEAWDSPQGEVVLAYINRKRQETEHELYNGSNKKDQNALADSVNALIQDGRRAENGHSSTNKPTEAQHRLTKQAQQEQIESPEEGELVEQDTSLVIKTESTSTSENTSKKSSIKSLRQEVGKVLAKSLFKQVIKSDQEASTPANTFADLDTWLHITGYYNSEHRKEVLKLHSQMQTLQAAETIESPLLIEDDDAFVESHAPPVRSNIMRSNGADKSRVSRQSALGERREKKDSSSKNRKRAASVDTSPQKVKHYRPESFRTQTGGRTTNSPVRRGHSRDRRPPYQSNNRPPREFIDNGQENRRGRPLDYDRRGEEPNYRLGAYSQFHRRQLGNHQ